jgi:hypothetical protein
VSWLELDDRILEHPKFIRLVKMAGSEGVHLWLGIKSYCGLNLTDGKVPADMLDEVRGPANPKRRRDALEALLKVGLLEHIEGGVEMHDYLDWSSSREQVLDRREKARERKAKSRDPSRRDSPRDSAVSPLAVTPGVTTPSSSASSPTSTTPEREGRPRPDGWKPNEQHRRVARERGVDVEHVAAKFAAHCDSKGIVFADWDAGFLKFLLTEHAPPRGEAPRLPEVETPGADRARLCVRKSEPKLIESELGPVLPPR